VFRRSIQNREPYRVESSEHLSTQSHARKAQTSPARLRSHDTGYQQSRFKKQRKS
jgi:hypothetical protein